MKTLAKILGVGFAVSFFGIIAADALRQPLMMRGSFIVFMIFCTAIVVLAIWKLTDDPPS